MTEPVAPFAPPQPGRLRARLPDGLAGLPRAFWVLWTGQLINRLGSFVKPFLILYLTHARGFSVVAAGAVLTVYGAGSLISQPVGGLLADHFGRRPVMCFGLASNAAANVFLGLVSPGWLVVTAAALAGLTADLYHPAAQALVADLVPAAQRRQAFSALFWAINLGFSVATVAAGFLAAHGFWLLFVGDAATSVAAVVLILARIPRERPPAAPGSGRLGLRGERGLRDRRGRRGERGEGALAGLRLAARDPLLRAAVLLTLGFATLYQQSFTTLPLAVRDAGLPTSDFGFIIALNGVLIVVIQPFTIGWIGRQSRTAMLALSQLIVGVGFALTAFAHSVPMFLLSLTVWTIGEIGNAGLMGAVVVEFAPQHLRGRYLGLFGLAWGGAGALAPALGTAVYGTIGPNYLWAGCGIAGIVLAGGQVWLGRALHRHERLTARR
ncbi:MAG TPA: MFS transporter [Mycobacteriales bacterium]|nr:MFS transporter [Mycobacteriales bacterium]